MHRDRVRVDFMCVFISENISFIDWLYFKGKKRALIRSKCFYRMRVILIKLWFMVWNKFCTLACGGRRMIRMGKFLFVRIYFWYIQNVWLRGVWCLLRLCHNKFGNISLQIVKRKKKKSELLSQQGFNFLI